MTLGASSACPRLLRRTPEPLYILVDDSAFPRVLCQKFRQECTIGADRNHKESQVYKALCKCEGDLDKKSEFMSYFWPNLWYYDCVNLLSGSKASYIPQVHWAGAHLPLRILLVKCRARPFLFHLPNEQGSLGKCIFCSSLSWCSPRMCYHWSAPMHKEQVIGLAQHAGSGNLRLLGLSQLSFCLVWTCKLSLSVRYGDFITSVALNGVCYASS